MAGVEECPSWTKLAALPPPMSTLSRSSDAIKFSKASFDNIKSSTFDRWRVDAWVNITQTARPSRQSVYAYLDAVERNTSAVLLEAAEKNLRCKDATDVPPYNTNLCVQIFAWPPPNHTYKVQDLDREHQIMFGAALATENIKAKIAANLSSPEETKYFSIHLTDVIAVPVILEDRTLLGLAWPRLKIVQVIDPANNRDTVESVRIVRILRHMLAYMLQRLRLPTSVSEFVLADFNMKEYERIESDIRMVGAVVPMIETTLPDYARDFWVCLSVRSLIHGDWLLARMSGAKEKNQLARPMPYIPWSSRNLSNAMRAHVAYSVLMSNASDLGFGKTENAVELSTVLVYDVKSNSIASEQSPYWDKTAAECNNLFVRFKLRREKEDLVSLLNVA